MRAPLALDCRPAPSTITPALTNSSLNFAIAPSSCSDGILPASESLLALTITMKRIALLPVSVCAVPRTNRVRPGRQGGSGFLDVVEEHDLFPKTASHFSG